MKRKFKLISIVSILILIIELINNSVYAAVTNSIISLVKSNTEITKDTVNKLKEEKLKATLGDSVIEDGKTHFYVVDSVDKFKENSHYMIVTYNKKENKFYALSVNSDGYQKEIPITSISELKNGFDIENDLLETEDYIFTCTNEGTKDSSSVRNGVKFKTNTENEDGKNLYLKLGSSNSKPWPIFDTSAGGIILTGKEADEKSNPYENSNIFVWKINKNGGGYITYYPYFPASHELLASGDSNSFFSSISNELYRERAWDESNNWSPTGLYRYYEYYDDNGTLSSNYKTFDNDKFTSTDWEYYSSWNFYDSNNYEDYKYSLSNFVILSDCVEKENPDEEMVFTKVDRYADLLQTYYNNRNYGVDYKGENSRELILVYTDENGKKHILGDNENVYETSIGEDSSTIIKAPKRYSLKVLDYIINMSGMPSPSGNYVSQLNSQYNTAGFINYEGKYLNITENGIEFTDSPVSSWYIDTDIVFNAENDNFSEKILEETKYKLFLFNNSYSGIFKIQDGNITGKKVDNLMTDIADSVNFDIYINNISKYNGNEFTSYNYDKYYKVTDLNDLETNDELIITYKMNDEEKILINSTRSYYNDDENDYSLLIEGLGLVENGNKKTNEEISDRWNDYLNLDGNNYVPFAYKSDNNSIMVMNDMPIALKLGEEKSISKKQFKYKGLQWTSTSNVWNKGALYLDSWNLIDKSNKEISFFIEGDNVLLRGAKNYLAKKDNYRLERSQVIQYAYRPTKQWVKEGFEDRCLNTYAERIYEKKNLDTRIFDGNEYTLIAETQNYVIDGMYGTYLTYVKSDELDAFLRYGYSRYYENGIRKYVSTRNITQFYSVVSGELIGEGYDSYNESFEELWELYGNDDTFSGAIISTNKEDAIPITIYRKSKGTANPTITYYDVDGTTVEESYAAQGQIQIPRKSDFNKDDILYTFVGWTSNKEKAGYLNIEESSNIYDYDDLKELGSVKQDIIEEYGLINDCNPDVIHTINVEELPKDENGNVNLYPIYAIKGYDSVVSLKENEENVIGISDWKKFEENDGYSNDTKEVWLGSINVEFYLDGEKWGNTEKMYFRYHNDNAADINLKFIDDKLVEEKESEDKLYEYMSDNSLFPEKSQINDYVIDGIYAEQGGSEGGLKYLYNWTTNYGGQLDNVKGGSTIKVYVSNKYKIKYYLDNELLGDIEETKEYKDESFYKTLGTTTAFEVDKNSSNYNVSMENEYSKLMDRNEKEDVFLNDVIIRGEYSKFTYDMNEANNVIGIVKAPEIDANKIFKNSKWVVKDKENNEVLEIDPEADFEIEGSAYGTGNTIFAYKAEDEDYYTYHLYLETMEKPIELRNISIQKVVDASQEDKDKIKDTKFKFELLLKDENNENISGEFECEGLSDDVIVFKDGKAEIELKDNEKVTIKNIPYGTKYSIEELLEENSKFKIDYEKSTALDGKIGHEDIDIIITNVLNNHKGTLIVHYLEKDTDEKLREDKFVNDLDIGTIVTEVAVTIRDYEKVLPIKETIEIKEGKNEITFYYTKKTETPSIIQQIEENYITNNYNNDNHTENNYNIINNNIVNNYYENSDKKDDTQVIYITGNDGSNGSVSSVKSTGTYASSTDSKYDDDDEYYKKDPDSSTSYIAKVPSTGDTILVKTIIVIVTVLIANIIVFIYQKKKLNKEKK